MSVWSSYSVLEHQIHDFLKLLDSFHRFGEGAWILLGIVLDRDLGPIGEITDGLWVLSWVLKVLAEARLFGLGV